MVNIAAIRTKEYDYPLTESLIAKHPLTERDHSKLLVYNRGEIEESRFYSLPQLLPSGGLVVFNNTKVIQARLHFRKRSTDTTLGAKIEIFLLEPRIPNDYQLIFTERSHCRWHCLIGNLKRWREGRLDKEVNIGGDTITLTATRIDSDTTGHTVEFSWDGNVSFGEILESFGEIPIPPYLNRESEEEDKQCYQTIYSKVQGSVAAPTAGLHFTDSVLETIKERGIETSEVTLHVGAGTFRPVTAESIDGHTMHTESIVVDKETIVALIRHNGKAIAVGTTSVRTLESLYYIGCYLSLHPNATDEEIHVPQWAPYQHSYTLTSTEALQQILAYLEREKIDTLRTSTQIIIVPGYTFHIVEMMITNFHQPQSTLLLLVSAFVNGDWRKIYDYALSHNYRFLSYGDSSLLIP